MRPRKAQLPPKLLISELIAFIIVGFIIGFGWAILLAIFTSVIGLLMLRRQAKLFIHPPADMFDMMNRSMVMLSGMLLFMPGFITDFFGLLCLIPQVRKFILSKFQPKQKPFDPQRDAANSGRVIEGEFWRDDKKSDDDQGSGPQS
ncbi:MAG: FxsA family protein [Gammaproteobacteria bacterium]